MTLPHSGVTGDVTHVPARVPARGDSTSKERRRTRDPEGARMTDRGFGVRYGDDIG